MTTITDINLEGREARCGCGTTCPSSLDLTFFEFRGDGSALALVFCTCGYHAVAHDPTAEHMARKEGKSTRYENIMKRVGGVHEFTPRGAQEFDRFYCGCRGWD